MSADKLIGLLEEMIDLKLHNYAANNLKLSPEVARLLADKQESDRRRLQHIRAELVAFLDS